MFNTPGLTESVGSEEDKRFSLDVARESIVLLKNGDDADGKKDGKAKVLPIGPEKGVLMTGKGCDSLSHQIGALSLSSSSSSSLSPYLSPI